MTVAVWYHARSATAPGIHSSAQAQVIGHDRDIESIAVVDTNTQIFYLP